MDKDNHINQYNFYYFIIMKMSMKLRMFCLAALMMLVGMVSAQKLTLNKRMGANWNSSDVTMKNKPNGIIYRLREDIQCEDLPRVPEVEGLIVKIAEPIDQGWLALYRLPLSADDYNFVVVLYNHDKQPTQTINLCDISNNRYCEVQDVRWDGENQYLMFNMACPSYSSGVNGKGSKLHCYDVSKKKMVWETNWLTSNDIFIFDDQFVYCSYGFTDEKDYLFMLDKFTGKVYSKIPMAKKVDYLELKVKNDEKQLYAIDYNKHLFIYNVEGAKSAAPKLFVVVYATSSDGFLNLREKPSTSSSILGRLNSKSHDLGNGVLLEYGDQWSKVSVNGTVGYVFTKYMGRQTWYDSNGANILVARDNINIYGEDFSDSGHRPVFATVKSGTVIADQYKEYGEYYVLETGHDNLFVKKTDVIVRRR